MRTMRSLGVLLPVLALSLFCLASPARAGSAVAAPVSGAACGELFVAQEEMGNPTLAFLAAGPGLCEKLCRKGGKLCRGYTKKAFSCALGNEAEQLFFALTSCEILSDTRDEERECKLEARTLAAETAAGTKASRVQRLAECEDWTDSCVASCPQ